MAKKKKLQVWLPLLLSLCVVAGMFLGYRLRGNMPSKRIFFVEKQKPAQEVLDLVRSRYVDKVNIDSLGVLAIESVLNALDPHSVYIPALKLPEINEGIEGVFLGIGIEFSILSDTVTTLRVLEGGPAEKSGLATGDKILSVNDHPVAGIGITSEKLKDLIQGRSGSTVKLELIHRGQTIEKEIKRGPVIVSSIDASYMVNDTTGYIRINKFSENTYKEFMKSMDGLNARGLKALILDLRDNGGGILTEAVHIADEFLDDNKLITYTEGIHSGKKEYRCDKPGVFEKGRLVVIINEGTASASEVLSGALQDWDRAIIVGRRSFGKGLVQEQYELSDGSGVRLTVARYFTPLGRSIQRPYEDGSEAYYHEIIDRFQHGEMESADSIHHEGQAIYTTANGRRLYSGGGITPDIFVPIDTLSLEKPVMRSLLNGSLNRFATNNFLKTQSSFEKLKTIDDYKRHYVVADSTLEQFKDEAKRDSVSINLNNHNQKNQLAIQIKQLTARLLWGSEGFFEVKNESDSMFTKSFGAITGLEK